MYRLRTLVLSVAVFALTMPLQVLGAEEKHEEHKESHYHRNHVGLLVGNTHEEHEDAFTVGLDYESRRYGTRWWAGADAEGEVPQWGHGRTRCSQELSFS